MNNTNMSHSMILIAVNGSNSSMNAAGHAISLAEKYNAQLAILNVFDV